MKNTQKLRISFVYDDSMDGSEGVAQYVKTLGSWLSGQGHSVSYMAGQSRLSQYRGGKVYSLAKNVPVKFNGNKLSIPLLAQGSHIKAALADAQPEILHIQVPYSPFMAQKVINCSKGAKIVGTFHIFPSGWLSRVGTRLLKYLYGRSLTRFDKFFSVSRPARDFAARSLGISSDILPNMVEIARFPKASQNDPNSVVFLGRLVERKGCRYLIEAFAEVLAKYPKLQLTIAGDGEQRKELEALAKKLKIADSVKFLGFVTEQQKAKLLASAKIACFPSLYGESFGIVLVEAMAAGSGAVLAGNNPGYASVMLDDKRVLFDPKDKAELVSKILSLLDDSAGFTEIHNWQQKLVDQYDVETVGPKILNSYYELIAKKDS
jgi:phosphatidylinositol alpha-mannosyltransferase